MNVQGKFKPRDWIWASYPADWIRIGETCLNHADDDWAIENIGIRAARLVVLEISKKERRNADVPAEIRNSALVGVYWAASAQEDYLANAGEEVARLRAKGYRWKTIAAIYGISEAGVLNRFGAIPSGSYTDDNSEWETDLWPLMIRARAERAFPTIVNDLVTQARCEGCQWKDIAAALSKSATNVQNKYGQGLSRQRVEQLNQELHWMSVHAENPSIRARFRRLANQAARAG